MHKQYDFLSIASFGHKVPDKLLKKSNININLHPSLLPRYRGATPIQHTILNRDKVTGVSIIDVNPKKFDIG